MTVHQLSWHINLDSSPNADLSPNARSTALQVNRCDGERRGRAFSVKRSNIILVTLWPPLLCPVLRLTAAERLACRLCVPAASTALARRKPAKDVSWATGLLCLHKRAGISRAGLPLATGLILPIMLRLLNGTVCMVETTGASSVFPL